MASNTVINGNGNFDFPAVERDKVSTLALQLDNDAVLAGSSFVVQGKVIGAPNTAYKPIPYKRRNLLGVVSDDTIVSAALGVSFTIQVDCAGMDVRLVGSGYASGSGTLYAAGMLG